MDNHDRQDRRYLEGSDMAPRYSQHFPIGTEKNRKEPQSGCTSIFVELNMFNMWYIMYTENEISLNTALSIYLH
jgi:hypothetical protein